MQDLLALTGYALAFFIIIIFVVSMITSFDTHIQGEIIPQIEAQSGINATEAKQMSSTMQTTANNLDYIVPLLVFIGGIVAFALAWQIPVSPIFLPLSILYFLLILVGGWLAQGIAIRMLDAVESGMGITFPLTRMMFASYMLISLIYGGIMLIATYAKPG